MEVPDPIKTGPSLKVETADTFKVEKDAAEATKFVVFKLVIVAAIPVL